MWWTALALAAPEMPRATLRDPVRMNAGLEGCDLSIAADTLARRRLSVSVGGVVVAEGRGQTRWSGVPVGGPGVRTWPERIEVVATDARGNRWSVPVTVPPSSIRITVDGAPIPDDAFPRYPLDRAHVVELASTVACPGVALTVTRGDGVAASSGPSPLRITLPAGQSGRVAGQVDALWNGWELERSGFSFELVAPPPCDDDDDDGLSECAGDCDDDDARVRPGFPEIPYDAVDNDCDGRQAGDLDGDHADGTAHVPGPVTAEQVRRFIELFGSYQGRRAARGRYEDLGNWHSYDCHDADPTRTVRSEDEPIPCGPRREIPGHDDDGDGFGDARDCDDHDATRHPGATETEDGFDEDCDGTIDDGFPPRRDEPGLDPAHPLWLGVVTGDTLVHPFYLARDDVDAFAFALALPPFETHAKTRIVADSAIGDVRIHVYGRRAEDEGGPLTLLAAEWGNHTWDDVAEAWVDRLDGESPDGGGVGSAPSLTGFVLAGLRHLPLGAAVPLGVLTLPAAAVVDTNAALRADPRQPGAATPDFDPANPTTAPATGWVYVVVVERMRHGPGAPAELRIDPQFR